MNGDVARVYYILPFFYSKPFPGSFLDHRLALHSNSIPPSEVKMASLWESGTTQPNQAATLTLR